MARILQALKAFLDHRAPSVNNPDMLARWNPGMETQINVSPAGGEPVPGRRGVYTDEVGNEWFNIRIPKKAFSEPEFHDFDIPFVFGEKVEAIGMTGWDWKKRVSRWVGFDFDSITGHAKGVGVDDQELARIRQAACAIPCAELRRSTGGKGLHLNVYVEEKGIPTANHTEHAAFARAILGMMSQEAGFDFASAIDCAGGNMWFWHRKANAENQGLALIKPAEKVLTLADIPPNWKDHVEVVSRKRSKVRIRGVDDQHTDSFEQLASARRVIPLEEKHRLVIDKLTRSKFSTLWVTDHHLLQTHTAGLRQLIDEHKSELGLLGFFTTLSEGNDPATPNCFAFPLAGGGWQVYRFSPGARETEMWEQDGSAWTTCRFNVLPNLPDAAKAFGGIEHPKGKGWVFDTFAKANRAAKALGQNMSLPERMDGRETVLTSSKDGRLVAEIKKLDGDDGMSAWLAERGHWMKVFNVKTDRSDKNEKYGEYDNIVRALISPAGEDAGYVVRAGENGDWIRHPATNVHKALLALGHSKPDAEKIVGASVLRGWRLVNLPFHGEYPGGRKWNFKAAQLRYKPAALDYDETPHHPHWDLVLNHCGCDLSSVLKDDEWAKQNGIRSGGDYLRLWIACLLREPFEPLPYLFLYGEQNSGKSILHESISLLVTAGVVAGDRALTNQGDFNGELANAVLCYVEETDVARAGQGAYNKIKDWVTGRTISIHPKRKDVYLQQNTTHWIQCANTRKAVPIFKGDTRIIVMYVPEVESEIPKPLLIQRLEAEAPHFMRTLLDLSIPDHTGRLRIPVIETYSKTLAEKESRCSVDVFLDEHTVYASGHALLLKDVFERFRNSLSPDEALSWNSTRLGKSLPDQFPTGKYRGKGEVHVGNIAWEDRERPVIHTALSRASDLVLSRVDR